ncbi:hypothetical protein BDN71DRAFT_1435975 [Pleurotus eryngii]|uniref:Uncharacterized protein n=1 Tax=Pleurotus eryngii TaxID=5323 RepID=A0A9P5ZMW2_PLEER|nr:hypothetical protein BDN71DRAFT_1435975 [Pleurotus eryngii]
MALLAQWTMERTIGNLGAEIRHHQDPYANLTQRALLRALLRAQCGAFYAMVPGFISEKSVLAQTAWDLQDGYALLQKRDDASYLLDKDESTALCQFLRINYVGDAALAGNEELRVFRWARLRLPNGHTARSVWAEKFRKKQPHRARNVAITINNCSCHGEVQFYCSFMVNGDRIPLALVAFYTTPDADLLCESSDTLWVSLYPVARELLFVRANSIQAVVGKVPFKWKPVNTLEEGHITKPGLRSGNGVASFQYDEWNSMMVGTERRTERDKWAGLMMYCTSLLYPIVTNINHASLLPTYCNLYAPITVRARHNKDTKEMSIGLDRW